GVAAPARSASDVASELADELADLAPEQEAWIGFFSDTGAEPADWAAGWRARGYVRAEVAGELVRFDDTKKPPANAEAIVVLDRIRSGAQAPSSARMLETVEGAFEHGDAALKIAGAWRRRSERARCPKCDWELPPATASMLRWSEAESACPECAGTGERLAIDPLLLVPFPQKSLREGAVAPLGLAGWEQERSRFLKAAAKAGLSIDKAVGEFTAHERELLWNGNAGAELAGVQALVGILEAKRGGARKFQRPQPCPTCGGGRLAEGGRTIRLAGLDFPEMLRRPIEESMSALASLAGHPFAEASGLPAIRRRLEFLRSTGLGYLELDRALATLSTGEARRVGLAASFGAGLSRMLYVLDEPTAGLHAADVAALVGLLYALRDAGNTVLAVEHDLDVVRAADWVVELGPGAGSAGGEVTFEGTPDELAGADTITAEFLAPAWRPETGESGSRASGWLRLRNCRTRNLKEIDVAIPTGMLTAVAGVSGAGKSTLVFDTLHLLLLRALGDGTVTPPPALLDSVRGVEEVVAASEIGGLRSSASNAATYLKFFDDVRKLFAETLDAKTNGLTASDFSFNTGSGRCPRCEGAGSLDVDLKFLPGVSVTCPECRGKRYQRRVLDVKLRGRNIAETLELSAKEAFGFFRSEPKILEKLKALGDVGLGYLSIGQPANTLSGGESQRLKLASFLSQQAGRRTVFLFEEPTAGLHPADVGDLLECLRGLPRVGHTVVAVENNPYFLAGADHVIELGPGAGKAGGAIVAEGTPSEVAKRDTPTGRMLAKWLDGSG
ncbi:MAG TPA: excinuclease ABC subunit A, partial [Planctomycetia bacterium]|nr:excinuclease ABC subunit A [Planctomycetia bacterium]